MGVEYERVIITGASSGLGAAFARALATVLRHPCEMLLIARRRERLNHLAEELNGLRPGMATRAIVCDLSAPAARAELLHKLSTLPQRKTLLINNAGLGDYGEFESSEAQKNDQLLQVNILAVVELTRALLPHLLTTGGDIINIASLAADVALPDFALYSASKAFVASYSEALRLEVKNSGVRVLAVCPGPVHTEFGSVAQRPGHDRGDMPLKQWFYTAAEDVVQAALRALKAGRARCYPSAKIWLSGSLLHICPLWLLRLILSARPRRVKQINMEA